MSAKIETAIDAIVANVVKVAKPTASVFFGAGFSLSTI